MVKKYQSNLKSDHLLQRGVKVSKSQKTSDEVKKLAEDHWAYLSNILKAHGENEHVLDLIGIHYKTAMVHGYKHGVQDTDRKRLNITQEVRHDIRN